MIEIFPNLFIGMEQDYEFNAKGKPNWVVVHACKYPYHQRELGYTGRAAPKNHPEYLIARRDGRLILNLVDAPDPKYIPKEIIDAAINYIHEGLSNLNKILIHCNLGESRSPSIGLLYLAIYTDKVLKEFAMAEQVFREIYPSYNPGLGMPQEQEIMKREIESTDKGIDNLVYEMYGLSEEEIRIVERKE